MTCPLNSNAVASVRARAHAFWGALKKRIFSYAKAAPPIFCGARAGIAPWQRVCWHATHSRRSAAASGQRLGVTLQMREVRREVGPLIDLEQ